MSLTYVSLCDGIGAVHVAWQPLGWRCAWVSEIEEFPNAVVAQRWGFQNVGDLRLITARRIDAAGAIDLVAGGTPCQSFSLAGRRRGLNDPRGQLALVYLEVVRHLRPRWVLWENVPGVFSSGGGRDFGAFVGALEQLGYGLAWRILDAQYFGVAQRRRRVFVVAYLGDWRPAGAVLLEPQGLRGHSPPRRPTRQNAARPAPRGANRPRQGSLERPELQSAWCMAHGQGGAEIGTDWAPTLSCNHEAPILTQWSPEVVGPLCAHSAEHGHAMTTQQAAEAGHIILHHPPPDAIYSFQPRIGRSGRGLPSPLVAALSGTDAGATSDSRSCVVDGYAVRRLTPRECERLQGFPDDYTLVPLGRRQRRRIEKLEGDYLRRCQPELTDAQIAYLALDGPRYRALGNSMAVPVMAWIGRRIAYLDRLIHEKTPAVVAGVGEGA